MKEGFNKNRYESACSIYVFSNSAASVTDSKPVSSMKYSNSEVSIKDTKPAA